MLPIGELKFVGILQISRNDVPATVLAAFLIFVRQSADVKGLGALKLFQGDSKL